MIDGFIFDMDGILFDTQGLLSECFIAAGREFGATNIEELSKGCIGRPTAETKQYCMERLPEGFPFDDMYKRSREMFDIKLSEGGVPIKTGAYLILEYLRANRFTIGLASSTTRKSIMHHLEETNMTEYFSVIVAGDEVRNGKPAPDIYIEAVKKMNLYGKNVIAFEDSPNGLKSATAAGLKAIMIPDRIAYSEELAPYVYEHFNTLAQALEALKKNEIK